MRRTRTTRSEGGIAAAPAAASVRPLLAAPAPAPRGLRREAKAFARKVEPVARVAAVLVKVRAHVLVHEPVDHEEEHVPEGDRGEEKRVVAPPAPPGGDEPD